ncbi:MAG: alpha/beta fold hydrolase [Ramlibacter sp.]|nr:alpha/beta fold hydrolase [Ramlibacter sp.]
MQPTAADAATPIVFDAAGSWCFGWFHRAAAPSRRAGVVMCRPLGFEAMCTCQTYAVLADTLARSGFDVLRFDYQGTGDSAGTDADPDRVAAWVASTVAAARELARRAGIERLSLFGVRMGATLAVQAAREMGGVESLVLWAPCVTGRAFTREMRAASAGSAQPPAGSQPGDIESLGFLYTAQTLHDLQQLDCTRIEAPPARRALIVQRDDMPGESPLPAAWRDQGVEVTAEVLAGYSGMMVEPHKGVVEQASLDAIADWLLAAPPAPHAPADERAIPVACWPGRLPDGIREAPLRFGPAQSLFGILTEPPGDDADAVARRRTAILFLNVGHNYRIGPNRLYVHMARSLAACGFRTLRFDLSGIGDSPGTSGPRKGNYYAKGSAVDVSAAIDRLETEGCTKFWLMGVCSGSFVAFQAALADPRVSGQVLMNPRLLEWQDGADEDMWQASMQRHYKSTAFYRRELMRPQVYRRLLRGEVDVNGIAKRVGTVLEARLKRAVGRLLHRTPREESVLSQARRISARGADTLLVMAADDDGRDYIEYHFGQRGSRMAGDPGFRMMVVEGCDHTFSSRAGQRLLIETVRRHLEQKHAP